MKCGLSDSVIPGYFYSYFIVGKQNSLNQGQAIRSIRSAFWWGHVSGLGREVVTSRQELVHRRKHPLFIFMSNNIFQEDIFWKLKSESEWREPHSLLLEAASTLHQSLDFFFFFLNNHFCYLFIYWWLCWVFVSVRGLSLVAASGGHPSSRCAGLSLSRPLLLRSTGSSRAGSVIVAHGPSCSAACGIFADQGSNLCPLHWQADSQPLRHQGSPLWLLIIPWIWSFTCGLGLKIRSQKNLFWVKNPNRFSFPVPYVSVFRDTISTFSHSGTCSDLLGLSLPCFESFKIHVVSECVCGVCGCVCVSVGLSKTLYWHLWVEGSSPSLPPRAQGSLLQTRISDFHPRSVPELFPLYVTPGWLSSQFLDPKVVSIMP